MDAPGASRYRYPTAAAAATSASFEASFVSPDDDTGVAVIGEEGLLLLLFPDASSIKVTHRLILAVFSQGVVVNRY